MDSSKEQVSCQNEKNNNDQIPVLNNNLSSRDNSVLDHIFDPEGNYSAMDPAALQEKTTYSDIDSEKLGQIKELEVEAIKIAESGGVKDLESCIVKLSEIIQLSPTYASAFNNRAQAYRMSGNIEASLKDLDKAIDLGHPANDFATLKQAYTQRGLLRKTLAKSEDDPILDAALSDLENGAKYGNDVAKKISAAENPYAKMCAAMVKEMLTKLE